MVQKDVTNRGSLAGSAARAAEASRREQAALDAETGAPAFRGSMGFSLRGQGGRVVKGPEPEVAAELLEPGAVAARRFLPAQQQSLPGQQGGSGTVQQPAEPRQAAYPEVVEPGRVTSRAERWKQKWKALFG